MSSGIEVERLSQELPSSPRSTPQPEHSKDTDLALSPTLTLGHSSPELPPLPDLPPLGGFAHTPVVQTNDASDTSYYTASWGSPYQHPPPRSIALNLAVPWHGRTPSASSEIEEDSPNPRFGLSHLLPSRLPALHKPAPSRPSTPTADEPPASPTRFPSLATSAQSIKQFFSSPTRPGEPINRASGSGWAFRRGSFWNSQGEAKPDVELQSSPPQLQSIGHDRNIEPFQLDGTADTLARTDRLRAKGHRTRDSNLTLTQEDFWPTFNLQPGIEKSTVMYASRYADTATAVPPLPPPKDVPPKDEVARVEAERKPNTDTIPSGSVSVPLLSHERMTPPVQLQRTESASSGRTRRTVKFKGKNVHINIPQGHGNVVPLTKEEVAARIKKFEEEGYNIQGFGNWHDADPFVAQQRTQNREIFPPPEEDIDARKQRTFKVLVPNKQLWDDYVAFLKEEKLRALGVSLGGGTDSPGPLSRVPSSSQFSQGLPFSPPLPTSSAGSHRHGSSVFSTGFFPITGGHSATRSIASPISAIGSRASAHMHRQSMFISPPPHQIAQVGSMQSFSPQLVSALTSGSPGISDGLGRRSPISPYGALSSQQGFPFNQRNELLLQMQRQKEQALHMQQQTIMQQKSATARPSSTLQEVPEAETEDDAVQRPIHSSRGERPQIVNPKPSHRHNISVKLERDIETSDYHLEKSIQRQMDEEESDGLRKGLPQLIPVHPQRTTSLKSANANANVHAGILAPSSDAKQNIPLTSRIDTDQNQSENVAPLPSKRVTGEATNPWADDPTFKPRSPASSISRPMNTSHNYSKSSVSRLNVAAKEFNPSGNPSATFNPGIFSSSAFSFTPAKGTFFPGSRGNTVSPPSRPSQTSSKGSFNNLSPAAPAFNPTASVFNPSGFGGLPSFTSEKSQFSFTSDRPSFKPTAPAFEPTLAKSVRSDASSNDQPVSIFGNIQVKDDGRKSKKSKAVPVLSPAMLVPTAQEQESAENYDEDGRLKQGVERQKRTRREDVEGDQVPLFALPDEQLRTIRSSNSILEVERNGARFQDEESTGTTRSVDANLSTEPAQEKDQATIIPVPTPDDALCNEVALRPVFDKIGLHPELRASHASPTSSIPDIVPDHDLASSTKETPSGTTSRVFSNASTLSAIAPTFDVKPSFEIDEGLRSRIANRLRDEAGLEETHLVQPPSPGSASLSSEIAQDQSSDHQHSVSDHRERLPSSVRYFDDTDQPSFHEIDAVMQHINEQGSDGGVERDAPSWPNSSPRFDVSPLPTSPQLPTFQAPLRSDAPSPSPRRSLAVKSLNLAADNDSASITQDPFSDARAVPTYDSPVRHLIDTGDALISDWGSMISSDQEAELREKAEFFGPHVSSVIKSAMDEHYVLLEKRFQQLMESQVNHNQQHPRRVRSRATVDSDADDEDDIETDAYSRGFSPRRDRRMDKFKTALQEALATHQPSSSTTQDTSQLLELHDLIKEIKSSVAQSTTALPLVEQLKIMIEETVARQNQIVVRQQEEAIRAKDDDQFGKFADRLEEASMTLAAETEARHEAEGREAESMRLLKLAEDELDLVKEVSRDTSTKLKALEEANDHTRGADHAHDVSKKMMDLAVENEALKETLEEYRLSSDKWRRDIDEANIEREKIHVAFGALKIQAEEALRIRETMRSRIEKLQSDMNLAIGSVAAERAKWTRSDAEHRTRYEILAARAEAEARTRERFERELERLETHERDAMKLRLALDHEQKENIKLDKECERLAANAKEATTVKLELVQTQKENARLEVLVEQLKVESVEHQKTADQYAREFREAREAGRLEVQRTRGLMEVDIDMANSQVNIVRADLEAEIARARQELDNTKLASDTAHAKHELELEQAADAKRDAIAGLTQSRESVLRELRDTYEERLEELRKQHRRDLDHTIENKNQSETFLRESHAQVLQDLQDHHERTIEQVLNEKDFSESQLSERLALADSKICHLEGKVQLSEEKLEIAKSAAHAAAIAARSAQSPSNAIAAALQHAQLPDPASAPTPAPVPAPAPAPAPAHTHAPASAHAHAPVKISPQALRESIAVLQEQLQEREARIEHLEQELSQVDKGAPAKIKARDTEIGWLRELIGVRIDDLSDLVNTLSQPAFDRDAARNAAIRIKASIQMEQQEKERQIDGSQTFPSLASISNFASPRAAQLAAAIGNWRKGGGGQAPSSLSQLNQPPSSLSSSRTQTPSKPSTTAQNFLTGLMTPPASNLRKTPSPDLGAASRPRALNVYQTEPRPLNSRTYEKRPVSRESTGPSTPTLLKGITYDQDAEESTTGFYDDEESTADGTPRAQRLRAFEPFGSDVAK